MPIKPITGVRRPGQIPSASDANSDQMLRRGLVLDLSVAFGMYALTNDVSRRLLRTSGIQIGECLSELTRNTGLGTACGYFWWYGMYTTNSCAYEFSERES